MKGDVYKDYYPIDDKYKKEITEEESAEEIEAYFGYLADCIKDNICAECGQAIVYDKTWLKDEIKEYQHSAMCKDCQRRIFGL